MNEAPKVTVDLKAYNALVKAAKPEKPATPKAKLVAVVGSLNELLAVKARTRVGKQLHQKTKSKLSVAQKAFKSSLDGKLWKGQGLKPTTGNPFFKRADRGMEALVAYRDRLAIAQVRVKYKTVIWIFSKPNQQFMSKVPNMTEEERVKLQEELDKLQAELLKTIDLVILQAKSAMTKLAGESLTALKKKIDKATGLSAGRVTYYKKKHLRLQHEAEIAELDGLAALGDALGGVRREAVRLAATIK